MNLRRLWASLTFAIVAIAACSCSQQATNEEPAEERHGIAYRLEPLPEAPDAPSEFTETESGLKYRILRQSKFPPPKPSNTVFVHYVGWLDDGTEFDTTYDDGNPIDFRLKNVIAGWTEGLQLIGKGGMIELEIPPELGYGDEGAGDSVPPDATLHFKVELIAIF